MVTTPASSSRTIGTEPGAMQAWVQDMFNSGVAPEQALALISFSLLGRMASQPNSGEPQWPWSQLEDGDERRLALLQRRLETITLAINIGAPLRTHEVGVLLGVRPGSDRIRRGDVLAQRLSRNVWRLSRCGNGAERQQEAGTMSFMESDEFRRRL